MKVYKLFIATIIVSLGFISSTHAQSPPKGLAVGIRTSNFNNIDLTLSIMRKENKAVRFRAGGFNYNYQVDMQSSSGGLRLAVGFQRFNPINDKFSFYHGLEPAINYTFNASDGLQYSGTNIRLGYMLGFNYAISDHFNAYVETTPAIYANNNYYHSKPDNSFTTVGLNASSQLLGIGATYSF